MTHVVLNKRIRVHIGRMQGYICKTDVVLSKTKQPKKKKTPNQKQTQKPKNLQNKQTKSPTQKKQLHKETIKRVNQ